MNRTSSANRGACIFLLAALALPVGAQTREAQWQKVREAMNQQLPRTAIEHLDPIIEGAIADRAWPEAIRAVALRAQMGVGLVPGREPPVAMEPPPPVGTQVPPPADDPQVGPIVRLRAELDAAPEPMRPVLEAILAHWTWQYFQQNQWQFAQRTQTDEPPGDDIRTWDLPRILEEVDTRFTAALENEAELKATPIGTYDPLLEKGTVPDAHRPTLFDFLAHEALSFYSAGEQGALHAEDAFAIPAGSPVFDAVDAFLAWDPETSDAGSPLVKAVRLYQRLLAFHRHAPDPTAFIDADLERLRFGFNQASGEEKDARYMAALERLADARPDHPLSAVALHRWAERLHANDEWAEAHRIASRGAARHADTPGAALCRHLVARIEAPDASTVTERVWTDPMPSLDVNYRNIEQVYFRLVPYDAEQMLRRSRWSPDLNLGNREVRAELLARASVRAWSARLPPTPDYRPRTESLPAPEGLSPGFYVLLASPDAAFALSQPIHATAVWVSDLSLVVRQGAEPLNGFVLDARTGEPIADASVQTWTRTRTGGFHPAGQTRTDADGRYRFETVDARGVVLLAEHNGQRLASDQAFQGGTRSSRDPLRQTVFFTDRAIYRPGQTVYYKGISVRADTAGGTYAAVQQARVDLVFLDVNHQEIARASHRTNDFGSFSGAFTAPRGRVAGMMTLRVADGAPGQTHIRVEEYRRPRFRVELDAPAAAPRLDEEVAVSGNATAFTGAAVGGAAVRWRVERMTRFPPWRFWFFHGRPTSESQAIAHGTAVTDPDGSFPIRFTARPDPKVAESDDPVFRFRIIADVTDTAGETRTAERTVSIGYTALQATMTAATWLTPRAPVEIAVVTQSPDGEGRSAEGIVRIHPLRQPDRVPRPPLHSPDPYRMPWGEALASADDADPSDPNAWDLAPPVAERRFTTGVDGKAVLRGVSLPPGLYRAVLETQDRFGKPVAALLPLRVVDPEADRLELRLPNLLAAESWSVEPGSTFRAIWGTGYETGRAFVEVERDGKTLQSYWTDVGRTQSVIEQPVEENLRGGFTLRTTFVRENRAYIEARTVEVPWSNKQLSIAWERFTSRLEPGGRETWTAVVRGAGAETAAAEMVAGLYDASLDPFTPHEWMQAFTLFRREQSWMRTSHQNTVVRLSHLPGSAAWPTPRPVDELRYRAFPYEILAAMHHRVLRRFAGRGGDFVAMGAAPMAAAVGEDAHAADKVDGMPGGGAPVADDEESPPDLAQVAPRRILDETAFFFPHLTSEADGTVRISFTAPEALTEWRFQAFAHDARLRSGYLEDRAVTAKDLMVEPNPPRFLREGDELAFTVKVTNQTGERQAGRLRLNFLDARTLDPLDAALANEAPEIAFDVPPMEARAYAWRIRVPDGAPTLIYRAVGSTGMLSDGEEGYLPVLSRWIFVTESLPLSIRGPGTRAFDFERLRASAESPTLRHQALTVQMTSNPAWYAVLALPYLMEAPHRSGDRIFTRLYANALARHIAASDPKIRRVFDQWRGTDALDSPLERNEDLKDVAIEETPWLRQAQSESEARRHVGILFDANRLDEETLQALDELARMQSGDGLWPWFPGGRPSPHTTLGIVTGFGRLRNMGVDIDTALAVRALRPLDAWMAERYDRIERKDDPERPRIDTMLAFYLYGRTFFIEDRPVGDEHREAFDYWLSQARRHWTRLPRQSQAHLALALHRLGDTATPGAILRSLKERASLDPDLGMHWIEPEVSWWWYRAPIETQAMMIEAFDEVAGDREAVEDAQAWLLTQKRTQHWRTTRATADAVYALLMRGADLLASDAIVGLRLGGEPVRPEAIEPGTGFYEQRFGPGEVRPEQGRIEVEKTDEGLAWGGVHWQYFEDVERITPYEGTPLTVRKRLYTRATTARGPELRPLDGPVEIGDELVARIELRVDRDMEYIHLKDHRGSGTEPVDVLSRYRYQDGLGYYESTRDTATHFFIERLPRGVYVFEYAVRVRHAGRYPSGLATIQCLYAPEFNSHSESIPIEAR